MDGPRGCADDNEVPPLRAATRRRGAGRGGLQGGARGVCQPGGLMAETPGPVARLDDYLATVTYVHEAIWELRTAAVILERDDERVHGWFREATQLVVVELP